MDCFVQLKRLLLLVDIVLDMVTTVMFYQEGSYAPLGVFILILVGSSLLVQAYSWLWHSDKWKVEDEPRTRPGTATQELLKFLQGFQPGINVRHLEVLERSFSSNRLRTMGAKYMNQDLDMLRVVEMFSESLPELILMITINLKRGHLVPVTVLKAVVKVCGVALGLTSFLRVVSSGLPKKYKLSLLSSVVYFLWNLLLIVARVAALTLFASEMPSFIFAHFICSWIVLSFCAWRSQTNFMDSKCGERLHRATLGLIWYFNWFNFNDAGGRPLLYHCYILADITLLCGLWFWKIYSDFPNFNYTHEIAYVCIFLYIFGLLCKALYFKYLHPHVPKEELESTAPSKKRKIVDQPIFELIKYETMKIKEVKESVVTESYLVMEKRPVIDSYVVMEKCPEMVTHLLEKRTVMETCEAINKRHEQMMNTIFSE